MGFRLLIVVMNRQPETLGVARRCVAEPHTLLGFTCFQAAFVLMAVVEWGWYLATSRRRSILGFRLPVG